ncbi:VOC family protein [Saccharopolyspora halophila]|uniref:VOC family protein n=1 Tax=Saccharopolyspora halophila TaxID=405551 RepID=A0ABN3FMY3_9PSEU
MWIEQVAVVVDDYDRAIEFFVGSLGFELVEDSPSLTNDGRVKRWVVVRPPRGPDRIAARASRRGSAGPGGRRSVRGPGRAVLRVEDFDAQYQRMRSAGVEFVTEPRDEPYGRVAVFLDVAGNRWDLLGAGGREATASPPDGV